MWWFKGRGETGMGIEVDRRKEGKDKRTS